MNTRSITNIILVVSGLLVLISGIFVWAKLSMPFMKLLHINASLVMTGACLVHVWMWRASLVRCLGNGRSLAVVIITTLMLAASPLVLNLSGPGKGQRRAEVPAPVAETVQKPATTPATTLTSAPASTPATAPTAGSKASLQAG